MQYVILPRNDKVCLFHSAMTGSRHPLGKDELMHYRTPGSKNGVRLYQNKDGSLTPLGYKHYGVDPDYLRKQGEQAARAANKEWFDRQGPQVKPKPEAPRAPAPAKKYTFGAYKSQQTSANKPAVTPATTKQVSSSNAPVQNKDDKAFEEAKNKLLEKGYSKVGLASANPDLIKKIANQLTSKEDNKNVLQQIGDFGNNVAKAVSGTVQDVGNFVNNQAVPAVQNAANDVGKAVTGAVNGAGQWIGNAANDVGNWVGNAANDVGKAVSGASQGVGNWVTGTAAPAVADTANKVGSTVINGANTAGNAVGDAYRNAERFVNSTAIPAINSAVDNAGQFVNNKVIPGVQSAANNTANGVGGFFNNIGNAIGNAWNGATNWVGNAANDVGKAVTGAVNGAGQWVDNAANDVGKAVTGAVNGAGQWIGNAANDVGDWVGNAANDVGNAVAGAAQGVGNWIGNAANDVGAFATNAWNGLTGQNTYGNVAAEQLKEAAGLPNTLGGTRAGSDFANAINGAWNGVTGAATNLWNNGVVPAAQNVGQYASGVARGLVGSPMSGNDLRNVDQDVRNGYNASRPVSNVVNNVGNAISGAAQSIGNAAQNVWNNNVVPIAQNVGQYANGFRAGYNQTGMTPELINNSKTISQNFKNGANLGNSARNVVNNVGNAVSDVANGVGNTAQNAGQYASGVARGLTGSPMRDNDLRNVDQDTRNGYNAARNVSNVVSGIPRSVADTAQNVAKGTTGLYNQGVNYVNNNVVKPIQNFVSGGQQTRAAMQQALANMGYSPSFIRSLDDEGLKYVLDSMWGH